jgi:hypothetical protein
MISTDGTTTLEQMIKQVFLYLFGWWNITYLDYTISSLAKKLVVLVLDYANYGDFKDYDRIISSIEEIPVL